jgi:hypothetical protein
MRRARKCHEWRSVANESLSGVEGRDGYSKGLATASGDAALSFPLLSTARTV